MRWNGAVRLQAVQKKNKGMSKRNHIYRLARVGLRQLRKGFFGDVANMLKYIMDLTKG
jgi:hypothetical protein